MQNDIEPGMTVRSSDGDKLGKVMDIRGGQLIVEKGFFFPKDYTAPMEDVTEITDDGVYLRWGTDLVEANYDALYGSGSYGQDTAGEEWSDYDYGSRAEQGERASSLEGEERIPVHEEQLEASKKGMKEVGRIRVHKNVRTEDQHFTVPVRREEVTVERVQGGGNGDARSAGTEAFQEESKTFPIREEEVEITKRPVQKEEVRVHSHEEQEERHVSGTVRKEEVEIENERSDRP